MFILYFLPPIITAFKLSEVDLMYSIGDSISAGFGVYKGNLLNLLDEYRYASAFIGNGDNGAITLPKYIREFQGKVKSNHYLEGPSESYHLCEICYGYLCPLSNLQRHATDNLNVAQSGSMVLNLDTQFSALIDRISKYPDWKSKNKLGTLFIGANDICVECLDIKQERGSYEDHLRKLFTRFRNELPNTVLLVYPIFKITPIIRLSEKKPGCSSLHRLTFIECDCAFGPGNAGNLIKMDSLVDQLNDAIYTTVAESNKIASTSFISLQPILQNADISTFPGEALSSVDCFHISELAHANVATNMWNALHGQQDTIWNVSPVEGTDYELMPQKVSLFKAKSLR